MSMYIDKIKIVYYHERISIEVRYAKFTPNYIYILLKARKF